VARKANGAGTSASHAGSKTLGRSGIAIVPPPVQPGQQGGSRQTPGARDAPRGQLAGLRQLDHRGRLDLQELGRLIYGQREAWAGRQGR
jgi:hypothetical protein